MHRSVIIIGLLLSCIASSRSVRAQDRVRLVVTTQSFHTYDSSTGDDSITVIAILKNPSTQYIGNIAATVEAFYAGVSLTKSEGVRPLKERLAPGEETTLYETMYDIIGHFTDAATIDATGFTIDASEYGYITPPSIVYKIEGNGPNSGLLYGELVNDTGSDIDNRYCWSGCNDFKIELASFRGPDLLSLSEIHLEPSTAHIPRDARIPFRTSISSVATSHRWYYRTSSISYSKQIVQPILGTIKWKHSTQGGYKYIDFSVPFRNASSQTIERAEVVVLLRDASSHIVAFYSCDYGEMSPGLAPSCIKTFGSFDFIGDFGADDVTEVTAWASSQTVVDRPPTQTPTETTTPTTTNTPTQTTTPLPTKSPTASLTPSDTSTPRPTVTPTAAPSATKTPAPPATASPLPTYRLYVPTAHK